MTATDPDPAQDEAAAAVTSNLIAVSLSSSAKVDIVPADRSRDWMVGMFGKAAKRCLPLTVANQAGWLLLNPRRFTAVWDGGLEKESLTFSFDAPEPIVKPVDTTFGNGVISWRVPYLFRTDPGWNLLVRGPANYWKDGVSPLEGLVETDWAEATFTMNWKVTRADLPVTFEAGEPFAMIVPQRRHDLSGVMPRFGSKEEFRELAEAHREWAQIRREHQIRRFLYQHGAAPESESPVSLHYLRGVRMNGDKPAEHLTRLSLRPFKQP